MSESYVTLRAEFIEKCVRHYRDYVDRNHKPGKERQEIQKAIKAFEWGRPIEVVYATRMESDPT